MFRVWFSAMVLLSATASARDLTLTHQVRLLDAAGEPLQGAVPVTVSLHNDAQTTSALWTASLTPEFQDGYASLQLDTGAGGEPVDSAWFAEPVWVQLQVDGGVLGPRSRITDLPVHIEPAPKVLYWQGTRWNDDAVQTLASSTVDASGLTVNAGNANEVVTEIDLAQPGEFPNGVRIEVEVLMQMLTDDADPTFYIADFPDGAGPAPEGCGIRVLEQQLIEFFSVLNGAWPGTGSAQAGPGGSQGSGVNPISLTANWTMPPGDGGTQRGFAIGRTAHGETRGQCPANVHVENGVKLYIVRNNAGERYRWNSLAVTMTPL